MSSLKKLKKIRAKAGQAQTKGLSDEHIERFLELDSKLEKAIDEAWDVYQELQESELAKYLSLPEIELIQALQSQVLNFYRPDSMNPYVPLAAKGPWIVTSHGAVVHDSGGYGMLGFGHSPKQMLKVFEQDHVMANVMTASFSHRRVIDRLLAEIGQNRQGELRYPYQKFLFLNSGSEAMTVAMRISDLNAKQMTEGRHAGKKIKIVSLKGSFHGRTERPAQASDSTLKAAKNMASFRDIDNLITITPNDKQALKKVFEDADKQGFFIECLLMEPVMGEGNPGKAVDPEFYSLARELTLKHGSLLIMDSIQAGFRAHGYLSITDYPGYEKLQGPDLETYSKALNAGQYPLSVLALTERAAGMFKTGVYGNTMTGNPRALEMACAVLDSFNDSVRANIRERGAEFVEKFQMLAKEFPDVVTSVQGTGLLISIGLNEKGYTVLGDDCVERFLREQGIGVIHGGKNALRFTPHFKITSEEIDLIVEHIRVALARGPVYR